MIYVLGKPFAVGLYTVAIVSRQTTHARGIGQHGVAVIGRKEPAYVVVQNVRDRAALDMTGAKVSLENVSALCPAVATLF